MSIRGTKSPNSTVSNDQKVTTLVPKLYGTEDKINKFKADVESSNNADIKAKKQTFEENSAALLETVNKRPISNNPQLPQEVHVGVEVKILNLAEQIERQKKEIEDLKQVIKGKNEYIASLQTDFKKYKNLYTEQAGETQRLSNLLKNRDYEVSRLNREKNLDGQVLEFRENVREDQSKKMSPQKYVKNTNNDPYDFWRTSNEPVQTKPTKIETNKLDEILGKNALWVDSSIGDNASGLLFNEQKGNTNAKSNRSKKP